ncbi:DUF6585 family protein [Nocardia neocaledoniensis]|uniref:DUF6585 family protein n=1 Tax=Nocardia neocaledoniensis TaxID=236511 RepID=UPI0024579ED7|nr:DUF6585 family protein [Nocardia neocaledoniensis]
MTADADARRDEAKVLERIAAVAADAGLGGHLRGFGAYTPMWKRIVRRWVFVVVVGGLVAFAAVQGETGMVVIIGGFIVLPVFLPLVVVTISAYRHQRGFRGARLDLYENGLVRTQHGLVRAVRYDSTRLFRRPSRTNRGGAAQMTFRYDLTDTTGREIQLADGFVPQQEWAPMIDQGIVTAKLPAALERLRAGERLDFGEVWISATEVGDRKRSVPWGQVRAINLMMNDTLFDVTAEGKFFGIVAGGVADVPDFVLFRTLAERLRAEAAR